MSGGYVMMVGSCFGCSRVFSFNPMRVPSITVQGDRKPVCEQCIARANTKRAEMGLPPHVIHPEAYEAAPEEDLYE